MLGQSDQSREPQRQRQPPSVLRAAMTQKARTSAAATVKRAGSLGMKRIAAISSSMRPNDSSQPCHVTGVAPRSEEHTSELQSLMRISYAVFCLKKKIHHH